MKRTEKKAQRKLKTKEEGRRRKKIGRKWGHTNRMETITLLRWKIERCAKRNKTDFPN